MRAPPPTLTVLLVEDEEDDAFLTQAILRQIVGTRYEVAWVRTLAEVEAALEHGSHEVYLVDYRLGEHTGLDVARAILSGQRHAPVIMLTGIIDHDVDLRAAELGISDYLSKDEIDPAALERSIRYAISHQRALQALAETEERYALAIAGANDGIWDWDLREDRLYLSARWKAMLGYDATELGATPDEWFSRIHPADRSAVQQGIAAHLEGQSPHFESEHRVLARDGGYRWMLARGLAVVGVEGRPSRIAGSQTDVTDRKRAEFQLQHDALHDSLTGLPNRVLFLDRLQHAIYRHARDGGDHTAVLFLDLDRFKIVNDSLGHLVGDRLLVEVARRLESALRPGDTVARLGGDEFTVLLEDVDDRSEAGRVADRMLAVFADPFRVDDRDLYLSGSIGIAFAAGEADPGELIRDADAAMYRAKGEGKGRHAMFDTALHDAAVARLDLETRLRKGLERKEIAEHGLWIVYQPIVQLGNGRVAGFEALARWRDEDGTVLLPDQFIPVAEETGLIHALGGLMLRGACKQLAEWRQTTGCERLTMSVNISARQLLEPSFVDDVREALRVNRLDPAMLRLEITETEAAADPDAVRAALTAMGEVAGVRAHLDDFGTGTSSLTFLHGFPGDALKIDRSFVLAMQSDEGAFQIVKAILALAHNLGMSVIAEGVETQATLDVLRRHYCEYAQGFLLSRPVPAHEAVRLIDRPAMCA